MERKKASDFDPEVLTLFDAYVHGAIDRRGFLEKASKYAVGGVTAAMLLDQQPRAFFDRHARGSCSPRATSLPGMSAPDRKPDDTGRSVWW